MYLLKYTRALPTVYRGAAHILVNLAINLFELPSVMHPNYFK